MAKRRRRLEKWMAARAPFAGDRVVYEQRMNAQGLFRHHTTVKSADGRRLGGCFDEDFKPGTVREIEYPAVDESCSG